MTYKFRSDHFELGRRAAWDGLPLASNPFPAGTTQATLWARGWHYVIPEHVQAATDRLMAKFGPGGPHHVPDDAVEG